VNAPIYTLVAASSTVKALIGAVPRFYPFGSAVDSPVRPYAVWQLVYGAPQNKLADAPDEDRYGIQVDAYADKQADARALGVALRDAIEPTGTVVGYNGEARELDTNLYRYSFTVEFMTER
jgi:hypothetical protein